MVSKSDRATASVQAEPDANSVDFDFKFNSETTLAAKLTNAVESHRLGNLDNAEEIYRQILESSPGHPHALHFLGVIEHQKGDNDTAIDLIGRAIDAMPDFADAYSNIGAAFYAKGQLVRAEDNFRRASELNPSLADSHFNLGAVLEDQDRWPEAASAYETAATVAPSNPKYLKTLGTICLKMAQFERAIVWFKKFLEIATDDGEVSNNLGYAFERLEKAADSEAWYAKAAALCPDSPEINKNYATALARSGREDEAEPYFQRALDTAPEKWSELAELAGTYVNRGEPSRGVAIYEQILELRPHEAKLWNDYGVATSAVGHLTTAEKYFYKAIALNPEFHEAYNNLGSNLMVRGLWDRAIDAFKKAIELSPKYLPPHINLCLALGYTDRLDEAYFYAHAVVMHENYQPSMFSNSHKIFRSVCDFDAIDALGDIWELIEQTNTADFSGNFLEMLVLADDDHKTLRLVDLHRRWGSALLRKLPGKQLDPVPMGSRSGKIKIGIMSSDLRSHSVAKFALPLLQHYDRENFEIYIYSPFAKPEDPVQQEIKGLVSAFKITADMNEYEIAQLVRADEIDILFELNGFTRDNRLKVLPYKSAPIQVFWLGYPFTTGIPEVDYVLLDPRTSPTNDDMLVEKALHMPESWACFGSFVEEPINQTLPLERKGFVTFGSLNNPYKVTRKTIEQWATIMNRVPGSRFIYVRPECRSVMLCTNLINEFGKNGVGPERLHFVNNTGMPISHLSFYDEIDITLDTFPLTGGTTTCDALWMGVPVVSKVGPGLHQRLSYGLMSAIGLEELCVETDEDYIEKAVELAKDPESLHFLRRELRPSILNSSLCRAEDFGRNFCNVMTDVAKKHGLR